jgi:DNA-binding winged helix-turn-helix (wHTH) protein
MEAGVGPFRVGEWTADPAGLAVTDGERVVRLRPKVMDLLTALASRPGEVLSKGELLDLVWSDVTVGDASLVVAVGELRSVLGDRTDEPSYIETIPRRGYRLVAAVEGLSPRNDARTRFSLIGKAGIIPLAGGRTVIGRDAACDVHLDSDHVSRHHAALEISGDRVLIEDLGSKNGTYVGERRIEGSVQLRPGDCIRFGRQAAVLQLAAEAAPTVTEASTISP